MNPRELSDHEVIWLRKTLAFLVADLTRELHNNRPKYGPDMIARIRADIAVASMVVGKLPTPPQKPLPIYEQVRM